MPDIRIHRSNQTDLSELSTIEGCKAWIKREYPSACLVQYSGHLDHASVYDVGSFGRILDYGSTPLLALQNVVSQIKKWRLR